MDRPYVKLCSCIIFLLLTHYSILNSQHINEFSKYDIAHGALNEWRACYDVVFYEIDIRVNPNDKSISGSNDITFRVVNNTSKIQIDFDESLKIDSVVFKNQRCKVERDKSIVYVLFDTILKKKDINSIKIFFGGNPHVAKRAPWDGGFVWSKDKNGNDWVGMACEGIGASIWLPCKDHWSDEPDSMRMHITVPNNLTAVSNGRLVSTKEQDSNWKTYTWQVISPINLYNISVNIGDYSSFEDKYISPDGSLSPLDLSYYVLSYNVEKAKSHFEQVKNMLGCFELYFGPYPFWEDGYKLVETPYWGMEHQSCIAYGNNYKNNSYNFDYIIVHESGHEWFANSVTASDPADMWIHESFTTYSEALYVLCNQGLKAYSEYLNGQRGFIQNSTPIIGPRHVFYHKHPDNDMYYKGSWIIHTIKNVLDNDSLFFVTLKQFAMNNKHKVIDKEDVIKAFSVDKSINWNAFFNQYFERPNLPSLVIKKGKNSVEYRWENVVKDFNMPILCSTTEGKSIKLTPTTSWKKMNNIKDGNIIINETEYLIKITYNE